MKRIFNKRNIKKIALVTEALLIVVVCILMLVIPQLNEMPTILIFVGIIAFLLFSLVLTLALIRNERFREIRSTFKESNLPVYTDNSTMMLHDIVDENKHKD